MLHKAIRYRLYPTKEQEVWLAKTFGCCRKIWNLMLSDKIESYQKTKSFGKQTPAQYKKEYPYLKEVDSLALANVQLDLQQAMKNCFEGTKLFGFPKYKSAKDNQNSYTTNNQKGSISLEKKGIRLPKIGKVKTKIHRIPPEDWRLKAATITKERDGTYYVSVLFAYERKVEKVAKESESAVGLDYKSNGLYMDSNGRIGEHPNYYRESQERLAKAQRKLKQKKVGSKNYKKQQQRVAKIHRHIANQRKDSLQKKSTEIANRYDIVCVESLHMRGMANKGFGNGKATLDNGYGMFLSMLEYKLAEQGKYLVKVSKWYPSSQLCHSCGKKKKLRLEERIYECECGLVMDRDYNAAINILREGLRVLREEVV